MPPPPVVPPQKRPIYLVIALIVAWIIGMGGLMGGCNVVQFYQNPTDQTMHVHAPEGSDDLARYFAQQHQVTKQASDKAMLQYQNRMLPLGIANALLSGLLIVASARALGGRYGSLALVFQAVIANGVYTVVDYFLSRPVRDATIAAAVAEPMSFAKEESWDPSALGAAMGWTVHALFIAQLIALGLIAYALTRPAVIKYFQSIQPPSAPEQR